MAEKLNFPLTFYKCTECGGTKFVARTVADKEVEKGKVTPGRPTGTSFGQMAIADPTKTILTAPTLVFLRDICAKCGHEQIVYVDCKEMAMTAISAQMPKDFQK